MVGYSGQGRCRFSLPQRQKPKQSKATSKERKRRRKGGCRNAEQFGFRNPLAIAAHERPIKGRNITEDYDELVGVRRARVTLNKEF